MKFKFCGNIDCPEWLITEIVFLNKINAVKLRIILNNISTAITTNNSNFSKVFKMLEEMNFSSEEVQVIVGTLFFILKSSVKFEVDGVILNQELQQLGLPQENADSIAKVYKNNGKVLKEKLSEDIFKFNSIGNTRRNINNDNTANDGVNGNNTFDWKVNYVLADKYSQFNKDIFEKIKEEEDLGIQITKFDVKVDLKIKDKVFSMSKEVLGKLINDLEKASTIIKSYNNTK